MKKSLVISATLALIFSSSAFSQMNLLAPGDPIIAFDFDSVAAGVASSYPAGEEPWNIADNDSNTKYLNFGAGNGEGTGFFGDPGNVGAAVVQSIQFVTANDAVERDPTSYEIYGTNDAIVSEDNSAGDLENWTLITSGDLSLPDDRFTAGDVISFANSTAYTGYKVVFPTVKDNVLANSVQIGDVNIWESSDGTGLPIFDFFDDIRASGVLTGVRGESDYPALEPPSAAIDNDTTTKYLNFGKENSGFIVTPSAGETVIRELQMWTANDEEPRDPFGFEVYGTNDAITSVDNGDGSGEAWTLIDSGTLDLPIDRNPNELPAGDFKSSVISVDNPNDDAYTSYRFVVTSVKDSTVANSMQFSEIQFYGEILGGGTPGDFNNDGMYDCTDIDALTAEVASGANTAGFDLTGDGLVNLADVDEWLAEAGATDPDGVTGGNAFLRGDADLNGVVDVSDFNIWNTNKFTNTTAWCSGNFTGDQSVDVSDFNVWNGNKFTSSNTPGVVPEPAGLAMMLFAGLFGIRIIRQRR